MAHSVSNLGIAMDRKLGVIGRQAAHCETHGEYLAVLIKAGGLSGCPVCAADKRDMEELERKRSQFRARQHELARIPKRFIDKTFDNFEASSLGQKVAYEAVAEYVDNFSKHRREGRCMLLLGRVGTGKTHLAAAATSFLINQCMVRAIYRTVGNVISDIKATFRDKSGDSEARIMRELIEADLLVLDEVGATKQSEFELATLFSIINGRYEQCRPMVIVSNLSPAELDDALGARCVDRIRENGCIGVAFEWESARGAHA
ncbi:ATP-binding protein [Pseudomonas sp. 5P_3.1_Bac2]|uniref:ATP-binding protein n=1 Tax=Pseudomonas sp. 5P_3.1_Bac2 TaxID=2971617 RepID=UPI0021CACCE0|nr:ATP-binding protein [Pseudomonas sp. 5P_3.1_Bac2]MCU1717337.1 ATP-binding protein [Pseudomonas sp. 5P_3.1_Bac2]